MSRFSAAAALAAVIAVTAAPAAEAQRSSQTDQEHAQILQEFGGEVGGPLGDMVDRVGLRLATQAGSRVNRDFTLLNSPVANAFATPGGRVYVTRQLLALMNSEDELAFVLGHEAGHIAARHSRERQNRSIFSQIGAALLGVITGSSQLAQVAGAVGQQYLLSFSRSQEYESDQLGVRYIANLGYNPFASAEILESLGTYGTLQARFAGRQDDQRSAPSWNSTHPNSAARVQRVRQQAQALRPGARPPASDGFLNLLDGMVYDDDPRQGVIEGSSFRHPELRLGFDAPAGYGMQNGTRAVTINGRGGQALFSTGAFNGDLDSFALQALQSIVGQQGQVQATRPEPVNLGNGMRAVATQARVQTGNGGAADLTVVAYAFGPAQAYYFATLTPAGSGVGPFAGMLRSLRPLSAQEAAAIRPRVIDVVTVGPRDTIQSLAARMAYSNLQLERFRVLNGLSASETVRPGQRVKLIVYGAPARS